MIVQLTQWIVRALSAASVTWISTINFNVILTIVFVINHFDIVSVPLSGQEVPGEIHGAKLTILGQMLGEDEHIWMSQMILADVELFKESCFFDDLAEVIRVCVC